MARVTGRGAAAKAQPGFYVAVCDCLTVACCKIGHTSDLRERLHDSAYVTCFPPGSWRFAGTLELPSKEAAYAVETGVLQYFAASRLAPSELVAVSAEKALVAAEKIAAALGHPVTARIAPVYGRAPARKIAAASAKDAAASSMADNVRALLAQHGIAPTLEVPAIEVPTLEVPAQEVPTAEVPTLEVPTAEVPTAEDAPADFGDVELVLVQAALELREYQTVAAGATAAELRATGRAILQMACRCGKTPVAYTAARLLAAEDARPTLFLVPGLALLRQTAQKLYSYSQGAASLFLVGSDPRPVTLGANCFLPMTTDPRAVAQWLAAPAAEGQARWLISTYQSSELLTSYVDRFGLIVYDEAHRICGGRAPRPFNAVLLACASDVAYVAPRQLFMSATPAYEPLAPGVISMRDRALFGGVASRYYLRQGIAAGYVNDFRLELMAIEDAASEDAAMATGVAAAMQAVDKLLVFCRDVAHAERLCALSARVAGYASSIVHSRLPAGAAAAALEEFARPGVRAALFNCRMLQEGVEVPPLVGVFFAAPRHSPRDIIQSLCRPLNPAPGKPRSAVFLPIAYDPAAGADAPANLRRYASIVPFVDALLDEDPQLFDMLIGGETEAGLFRLTFANTAVGIDAATPRAVLAACRRVLRHGVAGAALTGGERRPERLLRADAIPWGRAYAELRRVVLACRRYPKTTDEWIVAGEGHMAGGAAHMAGGAARVNLHAVYGAMASRYLEGKLEPYQRRDLEALPGWLPWGAEGPYAWGPCMAFLEEWLAERGVAALALEINKGGYVGLEATPMERLSGALTCVNQQVFGKKTRDASGAMVVHAANRVPAAHAADLDRICARFGLRWRKEFRADGTVDAMKPTFIQEAYGRFKVLYAQDRAHPYIREHFPGYPLKHAQQCALDLRTAEARAALPPRRARGATRIMGPK